MPTYPALGPQAWGVAASAKERALSHKAVFGGRSTNGKLFQFKHFPSA